MALPSSSVHAHGTRLIGTDVDALPHIASATSDGDEYTLWSDGDRYVLGHCLDSVGLMRYWTADTVAELVSFIDGAELDWVDVNGDHVDVLADHVLADHVDACPACGQFIDYCQGHGDIGDPAGAAILAAHDDDVHVDCHPRGCEGDTSGRWVDVVFAQDYYDDEDAPALSELEELAEYLSRWDYGDETDGAHTRDGVPWGASDSLSVHVVGGIRYVLAVNHALGYASLNRRPLA